MTKDYGVPILVGAATAAAAPRMAYLPLAAVHLRGRAEPMEIFVLAGDDRFAVTDDFRGVAALHAQWLAARAVPGDARAAALGARLRAEAPPAVSALYAPSP